MSGHKHLWSHMMRNVSIDPVGEAAVLDQARAGVAEILAPEVLAAMEARLLIGYFRYQRKVEESGARFDVIGGIKMKLVGYQETHNLEFLIDVANLALVELANPCYADASFIAQDDSEHVAEL